MMKKRATSKLANLFLVVLISSFSLTISNGCDEVNPVNPIVTARIQITHASPDALNFDVYLGNTLAASNLAYLSTLPYISISGDAVSRITVIAAGTVTFIDTSFYFQKDKSFSVFVYDSLNKVKALILRDSTTSPGGTNASLRFINLSPNAPSLDVGAVSKTQPWFTFYLFPQLSLFRPIVGGIYSVYANVAGTPTNLAIVPNVSIPAGGVFTIIARGYVGGTGTQAFGFTLIPNN